MKYFQIEKIISIHKYSSNANRWKAAAHRYSHYIAYHTKGGNIHIVNGKQLTVSPGTLLFLNKNESYEVVSNTYTESLCVAFTGNIDESSFSFECQNNEKIQNIFKRLLSHSDISSNENIFYCVSALYELFYLLEKQQQGTYKNSVIMKKLSPAFSYITKHYLDRNIQNSELAKLCNLSERRFVTIFKNAYGNTPAQYIIHKRISMALQLLDTGIYSITQISEMCGFENVYYFSNIFKRIIGVSPNKYKSAK